jgi:hypothetical protein
MDYLRVVSLRKGRLNPTEFRLREGEIGLSVFALRDEPAPAAIIEAVRAAGKRGELAAVVLPGSALNELGLVVVPTPGGTPVAEVNAIHFEVRLGIFRRLSLLIRRRPRSTDFNDRISPRLCEFARLLS